MREEEESQDDLRALGLSNLKAGVAIDWERKDYERDKCVCWGGEGMKIRSRGRFNVKLMKLRSLICLGSSNVLVSYF